MITVTVKSNKSPKARAYPKLMQDEDTKTIVYAYDEDMAVVLSGGEYHYDGNVASLGDFDSLVDFVGELTLKQE